MRCSVLSCYRTACNSGLCDVHYVEGATALPQRQREQRQVAVLDEEPLAHYEVFDRHARAPQPKPKRVNVRHKAMRRISEELAALRLVGSAGERANVVAMVIFMAIQYGHQDPDYLAAITGFDREFVGTVVKRLIDNGCWEDGKFVFEYDVNTNEFRVELALHVLVGEGVVVRVPTKREPADA